MQTLTPFLWLKADVEAAMKFYASIFKKSKLGKVSRFKSPMGDVVTGSMKLLGKEVMFLNGGQFQPNESFSFFVSVDTQKEVDHYWSKLTKGGEPSRCGWLKDKYGISWQIIPKALMQAMADRNPARAGRAMQAMLQMDKIDIAKIKKAQAGK